jgi:hypothetical protein
MHATGQIDERLIRLSFQAGDKLAYSVLYGTYFKPLYRLTQDTRFMALIIY